MGRPPHNVRSRQHCQFTQNDVLVAVRASFCVFSVGIVGLGCCSFLFLFFFNGRLWFAKLDIEDRECLGKPVDVCVQSQNVAFADAPPAMRCGDAHVIAYKARDLRIAVFDRCFETAQGQAHSFAFFGHADLCEVGACLKSVSDTRFACRHQSPANCCCEDDTKNGNSHPDRSKIEHAERAQSRLFAKTGYDQVGRRPY